MTKESAKEGEAVGATENPQPINPLPGGQMLLPILARRGAAGFWFAVVLTGAGTGLAAAALTGLLEAVQQLVWGGNGLDVLEAAVHAPPWRHLAALAGAGLMTAAGQLLLTRLSSGNGIDITAAIWFAAGRLPSLRTLGSAILSVIIVGMGAALGREGAPKQAGAVIANVMSDRVHLSDEQRRLLVACGAGAGMAAAYGVPLGGALFSLEVLRGALALRFVLPALLTAIVATGVSWAFLPDMPTYVIPLYKGSMSSVAWALVAGPIVGLVSVGYVRAVAWADAHKPGGWRRLWAPVVVLGVLGAVSIPFPQLLGNGRDVAELAFTGQVSPLLLGAVFLLRPLATVCCLGSGAPGGLFTPSLAIGAMLGGLLGVAWSWLWPGVPPGLFALAGSAAMLAATTQGPISAIVLVMEPHWLRPCRNPPASPCGDDGDAHRAHHRAAINLRCPFERHPGSRPATRAQPCHGGVANMTDEVELPQTVSDEGTDSFLRGLPREDCPYPPGADERDAWLTGWDLAAAGAT